MNFLYVWLEQRGICERWVRRSVQPEEDCVRHTPNHVQSICFKHKQTTKSGALIMKHLVYIHIYTYTYTYINIYIYCMYIVYCMHIVCILYAYCMHIVYIPVHI